MDAPFQYISLSKVETTIGVFSKAGVNIKNVAFSETKAIIGEEIYQQ